MGVWHDCLGMTSCWKQHCIYLFLPPQVKQMAAVLLRRLLSSSFEEIYPGLTLEMQTAIKTELLSGIQQETSPTIRKKICDIAAELSRNLIGDLFFFTLFWWLLIKYWGWAMTQYFPCYTGIMGKHSHGSLMKFSVWMSFDQHRSGNYWGMFGIFV